MDGIHVVDAVEDADEEDHEDGEEVFAIPAVPPLVQIQNGCCPKLWKLFFIVQTCFVLFFLDIAFVPLKKHACNPFKGLSWNYENNTTFRDRSCHGHGCWEKQEQCLQNCLAYDRWLADWEADPKSANRHRHPDIYPNPLCFYWEEGNWTTAEQDSNFSARKFLLMKKRAETTDWRRRTASFWNVSSLIILLVWFVIFCSQCTQDYKMTSVLLLAASLAMYYVGNYLGHEAIDMLRCFTRWVEFNDTTGRPLGYNFFVFCGDERSITVHDEQGLQVFYLPPIPRSWTISYYLLGIRATVPLILIFIWACCAFLGPDFYHHRATTFVHVIMHRVWQNARRG